jgi:hypothetical protein
MGVAFAVSAADFLVDGQPFKNPACKDCFDALP